MTDLTHTVACDKRSQIFRRADHRKPENGSNELHYSNPSFLNASFYLFYLTGDTVCDERLAMLRFSLISMLCVIPVVAVRVLP
jgi:hypothetical protein